MRVRPAVKGVKKVVTMGKSRKNARMVGDTEVKVRRE